jgi:hypothetical protein
VMAMILVSDFIVISRRFDGRDLKRSHGVERF